MRSYCVLVLLFFAATSLRSQELIAEFPTIAPKIMIDDLLLAKSDNGGFGLCYSTAISLVVRVMDKEGKLKYQKENRDNRTTLAPIGTLVDGSKFQFIYENLDLPGFTVVSADMADESKVSFTETNPFNDNDRGVASLISDNEFYTVCWNKKRHQLLFGKYDMMSGKFDMKAVDISDDIGKKLSKAKFSPISNTTIPEPSIAAYQYKIYRAAANRLAIIIDGEDYTNCQLQLVLLNCDDGTININSFGTAIPNEAGLVTNSYIYENYLATVRSERGILRLGFYNIDSLQRIKEYRYDSSTPIEIMSSQLFTEADQYSMRINDKEFSKNQPKKVVNQLSKGQPFIYFEPTKDSSYVITVGNMALSGGGGGGFSPGIPGSTISTPNGAVYIPGTPGSFTPYGGSYDISRYFYALLEPKTFNPKDGWATRKSFMSIKVKNFVKENITGNKSIFGVEPEYQVIGDPESQEAIIVSYIKREGQIKLHRFAL